MNSKKTAKAITDEYNGYNWDEDIVLLADDYLKILENKPIITPYIKEQFTIIMRIIKRGIKYSFDNKDSDQLDLWQHLYDEIIRLDCAIKNLND